MLRRRQILGALASAASSSLIALPAAAAASQWPSWDEFKQHFLEASGRVVSNDGDRLSTYSEGQAYALFFSLVANDRPAFDRILRWTEEELCEGDLGSCLPAWLWGRNDAGNWGVLDAHSASDADLWLAYTLGEAGRLWNERRLRALSKMVAARVLQEETAELPGLGLCLLPGPVGFALAGSRWRLNASYAPLQLMRWFATHAGSDAAKWRSLEQTALKVMLGSAPNGWAADWIVYDPVGGFSPDFSGDEKGRGGYNAIRVYLWAGTLHAGDPARAAVLRQLQPMAAYLAQHGAPPEYIDIQSGEAFGNGPAGFVAAMLPFVRAQKDAQTEQRLAAKLLAQPVASYAYYGQSLRLFSQGWLDGRYRFAADGRLEPGWGR